MRHAYSFVFLCVGIAALVPVGALAVTGSAMPHTAAARSTLVVSILGSGRVASKPAGIACPARCSTTFPAGTTVLLTPTPKSGFRFLRWGGKCAGGGACRVKVSAVSAVTAEFVHGAKVPPPAGKSAVQSGSYVGTNPQNNQPITLYVAPGGRSVLNISIPYVSTTCTPPAPALGSPLQDHLAIAQATIKPNGSFSARASQIGVLGGERAAFTYVFAGNFQSASTTGAASVAGTFRESIAFSDNTAHTCTSNVQSWQATRAVQPAVQKSVVQPGNYASRNPQNNQPITFTVSSGGRGMTNISIPYVSLNCAPAAPTVGTPLQDHLAIAQATITPNGSFTAKGSQVGVLHGYKATFTYFFAGNFEGVNASGAAVAAGSFREDIVFADTATHTCTSNNQSWTATRTS